MILAPNTRNKNTADGIAVVGIGCHYPGASSPRELWENVLARRQQFRQMPDCRLPLDQYHDSNRNVPDKTYGCRAAVIDNFEFDWTKWRIPKATYAATDIVQWLALQIAGQALEDAGYTRDSVPRERTGVILGNTLTGEHTRANTMRTRWPFVRRALEAAASARGLSSQLTQQLSTSMEEVFKSVFPPVTEDTLAGGLSNTIAGRICNAFDLHGGGYVIDGACSSSLLAICTAANALAAGDLDLALAGGVDVSLDTFELIGFAKTGALAPDDMRVYDRRGNGFIPGEGCGFVALKRLADARRDGDAVYAILRGWGISSDGKGGLTAPSVEGQSRALRRAYQRSGYAAADVDFIEGHGTGTRVGDRVELEAIAAAVGDARPRSVGVTSFKSIVGHTKAAAGVGAFIKTVIALNRRVLPPTAGCTQPSDVFQGPAGTLYPLLSGELVDPARRLRAGVSAMGFGGINSHVTLESGDAPSDKFTPAIDERALLASSQQSELFVFAGASAAELRRRILHVAGLAHTLSIAELTDLAGHLAGEVVSGAYRAAVVATTPEELADRLHDMAGALLESDDVATTTRHDPHGCWWTGTSAQACRMAWLLPGQGSQQLRMAGLLIERHRWARELVSATDQWLAEIGNPPVSPYFLRSPERAADEQELGRWKQELARTEIAQPAICLASLLYARHLIKLGLNPTAVAGHSLGELTAFYLAGAFDAETTIKLAGIRGRLMTSSAKGSMASLACDAQTAGELLRDVPGYVIVANRNSRRQTVISGEGPAVQQVLNHAQSAGISARLLPVSGAFHSRLVADAAEQFRAQANLPETFGKPACTLVSSMTGRIIESGLAMRDHFADQILAPVDFMRTVATLSPEADLLVEVGPGRVLSGLANDNLERSNAAIPVASQPESDVDLNRLLARAFAAGVAIDFQYLFESRLVRPFIPTGQRRFIDNPCERPFQLPAVESSPRFLPEGLDSRLAAETGLSTEELDAYLSRRKAFLLDVIKADVASLHGALVQLPTEQRQMRLPDGSPTATADATSRDVSTVSTRSEPQRDSVPSEAADIAGLERLLLEIATQRTGFPPESLSIENRLLDDLNLDSIKAAELVAEAAKLAGVAGRIDPSRYSNASLSEVAAALRDLIGTVSASLVPEARSQKQEVQPPSTLPQFPQDGPPSWVRNFVVDFA